MAIWISFAIFGTLVLLLPIWYYQTKQLKKRISKTSLPFENTSRKELHFRKLVEDSMDGIVIIQNNRFVFINKAFCDIVDYSEEELYGIEPTQLLILEDCPTFEEAYYSHRYEKVDKACYSTGITKKGGERVMVDIVSTLINLDGTKAHLVTVRDVTTNFNLQKWLLESESKYRTLVENSQDGICITQGGVFKFVNKSFCRMVGYTPEELHEMNGIDLIEPSDRPKMFDLQLKRMTGDDTEINFTTQLVRNDKSLVDVDVHSSTIDYEGKRSGFFTVHDITETTKIQISLKESEVKYRALVENSQDGICIIQADGIQFVNESLCQMLDYTAEEIYALGAIDIIAPEDKPLMLDLRRRRLEGDMATFTYILRLVRKNGELVETEAFSSTIEFNGGMANFFTLHDITESRKMQLILMESEEKYRRLFEAESDAIFLIDVESGQIMDANPAASAIYGFSHEELIRMRNVDISAEPEKTSEATRKQQPVVPLRYHRKKDGSVFPVELSAGFTVFNNRKVQIVTSRDISERIRIQEALSRSEEKYRTLIEKALDGIIIIQDSKFRFVNRAFCEMIQYSEEELVGKDYLDLILPENRQEMIDYHNRRMQGEQFQVIYRSHILRKDGKVVNVELNSRTSDFNGQPAAFIIIRDITDRLKIEEELREAKKEMEELNQALESRVEESSRKLTEVNIQLINLQKENLQSQFDVLKQQVNPHFLFNSLNVLTSLIKIEPDLAEKFTEQLAKVYRYVLENKENELVSLSSELDFMRAYIFLLDIRFKEKVFIRFDIPEDMLEKQVLPLAPQLLIENAIKHNTFSRKLPLNIDITAGHDEYLYIVNNLQVRDSHFASTGIGLQNIERRYSLLSDLKPSFIKTDNAFVAKIPLL